MRNHVLFSILLSCFLTIQLTSQNDVTIDKKGLYGIYDSKKKWVLPATYISLSYLPINEDSYSKFLLGKDKNGSTIIDAKNFKKISPTANSIELINVEKKLFIIEKGEKKYLFAIGVGILNEIGAFDTYHYLNYEKTKLVLFSDNKSRIYYTKSNTITNAVNSQIIAEASTGFLLICDQKKYGVIDDSAKIVVPANYDTIIFNADFCEEIIIKSEKKWGVINMKNETIIPPSYEQIDWKLSIRTNKIADSCRRIYPVKENNKWFFVNNQNTKMFTTMFDSILKYIYPDKYEVAKDNKRGIINLKGDILFPFNYQYFHKIEENVYNNEIGGFYLVSNNCKTCNPEEPDGDWGIADSLGKLKKNIEGKFIYLKDNSRLSESVDSSNIGFVWNHGGILSKIIISVDSVHESSINENGEEIIYTVAVPNYSYNFNGGKTGIIDTKGKIVLPIEFDDLSLPLIKRRGEDEFENFDAKGLIEIIPSNYLRYQIKYSNPIKAKKNNKWGLYSLTGKSLITCEYDSIQRYFLPNVEYRLTYDSILIAKNLPFKQFICFKDENKYFFNDKGKFLYKLLKSEKIAGVMNILTRDYSFYNDSYIPYLLISINPSDSIYQIKYLQDDWDYTEGETMITNTYYENIYAPKGDKINFLNPLTGKYLFNTPIQDFLLNEQNSFSTDLKWSKTLGAISIALSTPKKISEITKSSIPSSYFDSPRTYQNLGYRDSVFFYKQNEKWYLKKFSLPDASINNASDSIVLLDKNIYKEYHTNYYQYKKLTDSAFKSALLTMEYPNNSSLRIVCSTGVIEPKTIEHTTLFEILNEYGDITRTDSVNTKLIVPQITSGKLNLIDKNYNLLFETWCDEIILPEINEFEPEINLSNPAGKIFNTKLYGYYNWPNFDSKKSVAYKIGKDWFLNTLDENQTILGPFEKIISENNYWIATKNNSVSKYSAISLIEVKN